MTRAAGPSAIEPRFPDAMPGELRPCDPAGVSHWRLGDTAGTVACDEVVAADCVVLLTAHREFLESPRWDRARLIVDTRNAIPAGKNALTIDAPV
jgi:hypothetical protein